MGGQSITDNRQGLAEAMDRALWIRRSNGAKCLHVEPFAHCSDVQEFALPRQGGQGVEPRHSRSGEQLVVHAILDQAELVLVRRELGGNGVIGCNHSRRDIGSPGLEAVDSSFVEEPRIRAVVDWGTGDRWWC